MAGALTVAAQVALSLCLAISAIAAVWDVRSRRIPNTLCLLLGLAAIAFSLANGSWPSAGSAVLHSLLALLAGMALFAASFIGGGDAKMYSAAALALPLDQAMPMLVWTSFSGLFVVVAMFIVRRVRLAGPGESGASFTVPYGLPIAIGFWTTLLSGIT